MDDSVQATNFSGSSARRAVVALRCPCGLELVADTDDGLVAVAQEHLSARHPRLAGAYEHEDILSLAYRRASPRQ